MNSLYDIISLVLISIFIPLIVLHGMKLFKLNNYNKATKILAITFFSLEVLRFFIQASFYEKGRIPSDDLKIGFVTFMAILSLFACFMNNKVGTFLKKIFILLSLGVFIVGIFNTRVYSSPVDAEGNILDVYSLIRGVYFLESSVSILIGILLQKENKFKFTVSTLLIGCGICLAFSGLTVFYKFYWNLSVEFTLFYFIEKGLLMLIPIGVFFISKIDKLFKD